MPSFGCGGVDEVGCLDTASKRPRQDENAFQVGLLVASVSVGVEDSQPKKSRIKLRSTLGGCTAQLPVFLLRFDFH